MSTLPRCSDCKQRVEWFRSVTTGRARPFQPTPVDGRTHVGPPAYPVEGGQRYWRLSALIEDLQVRRETGRDQAEDEAYDMDWHVIHVCPNAPDRPGIPEQRGAHR